MNRRVTILSLIFTLLLVTGMVGHILPVQSQLFPGDILVIDELNYGVLFRVDPTTGARTVLSDFSVGANPGETVESVAVEASGTILVTDDDAGTNDKGVLFRIDPTTGARTVLSDFGVGPNQGDNPGGVAVEASGNILVLDITVDFLFRIDPITGARTVLSDFSVGPNPGFTPRDVAVEASGNILVIDSTAGTGSLGALFRIDPITGDRTLLSNFGDGAPLGDDPWGVAVEASGTILVIDANDGTGGQGALFRVDPTTGARTVLSDFGVGANQGDDPVGVAVYLFSPPPVGGVISPINKLQILAPYLALTGLVAAVTTVFTIRKRRKD